MQTHSGLKFSFPPTPDMIDLDDIAVSLSRICRYAGHGNRFYSVAEHCVLLARYAREAYDVPELALALLMHDATEAYMMDLPRPVKYRYPRYIEDEAALLTCIEEATGIAVQAYDTRIKNLDWRILTDEKNALFPGKTPDAWKEHPDGELGVFVRGWGPRDAYDAWTRELRLLRALMREKYGTTFVA